MAEMNNETAARWLGDVPQDKQFWCRDGQIARSLAELEIALTLMTDDTFRYHSSETKHDFTRWVGDVIGDGELAQALLGAGSRLQAAQLVADRITRLGGIA